MSREKQIEVVTYERERLDYFTELMQLARTRYNLLYHKFKDAPYVSEEHQMLSDMGREVQFFGDVVEMLENGYRKQEDGEWISVEERLPEDVYGNGRERITVLVCTKSGKVSASTRCAKYSYDYKQNVWGRTGEFEWSGSKKVTHWMPLPEPPKGD